MTISSQSGGCLAQAESRRCSSKHEPQRCEPKVREVWQMDDEFQFAPEKPDEDHWLLLLKPLLKKDKARCDTWKDEVQNLLLFAGLFSAVATAFIIESYRGLQRDPESDIVILLSHIVLQLGPLNGTFHAQSQSQPLLQTKFSPTISSIRVNVFWFLSLILSLTTVLLGTVSLQWLREHQNYTDLSPRQQYAVFNMRNESLKKWHVRRIFNAMPILLQSALVLFFTGMIDFLFAFGHISVAIPVASVIGVTLIFLIATTLLPTIQDLSLFFRLPTPGVDSRPPAQCPYKSPQSETIRIISLPLFGFLRRLHPNICFIRKGIRRLVATSLWHQNMNSIAEDAFSMCIDLSGKTWPTVDLNWLAIRDGYMRIAFRRPLKWYRLSQHAEVDNVLPIWDILQSLTSNTHPEVSPLYHAFSEICDLALPRCPSLSPDILSDVPVDCPQISFLHDIVTTKMNHTVRDICLSDFYNDFYLSFPQSPLVLKHQNLFNFLFAISPGNEKMSMHKAELQVRLVHCLYEGRHLVPDDAQQGHLPLCLVLHKFTYGAIDGIIPYDQYSGFVWQVGQVIMMLFDQISRDKSPHMLIDMPCARRDALRGYMVSFGRRLSLSQHGLALLSQDPGIIQVFDDILVFISHKLVEEMSSFATSTAGIPTLLFYTSALYADECRLIISHFPKSTSSFDALLRTISLYKTLTIDRGSIDEELEKQLSSPIIQGSAYHEIPFSKKWWSSLVDFQHILSDNHDSPAFPHVPKLSVADRRPKIQ